MQKQVIYEQPLNERIRTFLRLEFLFNEVYAHLEGESLWHSRTALSSLLDIMAIFTRPDLKTEAIKELERQSTLLTTLERSPDVDKTKLGTILDEMDTLVDRLHAHRGQIGNELRQNEFLASIKQRSSIPGGTCDFDLPGYHFWLQQPSARRIHDLHTWMAAFEPMRLAVALLVRLVRESATFTPQHAPSGFYQKTLDPSAPCQLVRVALPADAPYFAEISGGRHRFSVRMLRHEPDGHAVQNDQDAGFELACCKL